MMTITGRKDGTTDLSGKFTKPPEPPPGKSTDVVIFSIHRGLWPCRQNCLKLLTKINISLDSVDKPTDYGKGEGE